MPNSVTVRLKVRVNAKEWQTGARAALPALRNVTAQAPAGKAARAPSMIDLTF